MCGISGIVAKNAGRYLADQQQMIDTMYHRGPDGNGIYQFDNCLLGHNRLSIVDLSTGGQPMLDDTGKVSIVFNGEIYGYKELRKQLDYPFKTESDTELIIALYKKYGVGLLDRLPGMFAFAIWDEEKQQLFAARDRFGEKPFYYSLKQGELVFASEIKAIQATSFGDTAVNNSAMAKYLNHGYTGPDASIFNSVSVLPPAHYMIYSAEGVTVKRYWTMPATTESISLSDAADKFEALFKQAVEKQMVADVECCAFLSGGLDSTSVVSVAKQFNEGLKTLSYGYKGEDSELPYARLVADMYKTHHIEIEEKDVRIADVLVKLAGVYDEPFGDSSAVSTYMICKRASEYCKVVLTGDGADELLGGYVWWYKPIIAQQQHKDTSALKYNFIKALAVTEKIAESTVHRTAGRKWRDKYHNVAASQKYATPLQSIRSRFDSLSDKELLSLGLPATEKYYPSWKEEGTLNDAMKYDIADYMPGDILVKTDRAAMASSLELRSPFLDVDLATFCISLPDTYKITASADKILLREALSKKWPEQIRKRPKQGFGLVKNTWSKSDDMQKLYADYVKSAHSPLYKLLPYTQVQALLNDKPQMLHSLLILALWSDKNC